MTTPTLSTIVRAFEKAATQGKDYDVLHIMDFATEAGGGARYRIAHKVDFKVRNYAVEVYANEQRTTCDCPEHERSGFCKHGALAVEDWQIREAEARYEDRF